MKSLLSSRSAWGIFQPKAVWVTSESGDGVTAELKSHGMMYRKELVPQNRYEG